MHQVQVSSELRLLVLATDHIRVGGDHFPPGLETGFDLGGDGGLVARAIPGAFGVDLLLQLLSQRTDGFGLLGGVDVAAEADGRVDVAVHVVGRHGFCMGPLVAGFLQLADVGTVGLAQQPLEDRRPVLHKQAQQN